MCVPCKINFKLVQLWHLAADTCDPSPKKVPFSLPKHKCDLLANGKSSLTATTTTTIILVQFALLTNAIKFIYANLILKATLSEHFTRFCTMQMKLNCRNKKISRLFTVKYYSYIIVGVVLCLYGRLKGFNCMCSVRGQRSMR